MELSAVGHIDKWLRISKQLLSGSSHVIRRLCRAAVIFRAFSAGTRCEHGPVMRCGVRLGVEGSVGRERLGGESFLGCAYHSLPMPRCPNPPP